MGTNQIFLELDRIFWWNAHVTKGSKTSGHPVNDPFYASISKKDDGEVKENISSKEESINEENSKINSTESEDLKDITIKSDEDKTISNQNISTENIEDTFPIPIDYIKHNDELFILRVTGESMINAGINDKDLAIIEKASTAKDGDIVVALIDNEATIKRFFKEKDHIRLQPENDNMEPIIVDNCS